MNRIEQFGRARLPHCVVRLFFLVECIAWCTTPVCQSDDNQQTQQSLRPMPEAISTVSSTNLPGLVNRLVNLEADLRSQDFARRQLAMTELWGNREEYRAWVEAAATDPDPEVARRASWVLDRWRRGLLPDTPRDIALQLEASSGPDTIESLLNAGLFQGAIVAIEEAIGGAASPAILDRAKSAIQRRFPFYVRRAFEKKSLDELVLILDKVADEPSMTFAHYQLQRLTASDVASSLPHAVSQGDRLVLPSGSQRWTAQQRNKTTVITLAASGQLAKATELAEESNNLELLRVCRMLAGQWDQLAKEQADAAKAHSKGSLEWYRHWTYALIASSRGDQEGEQNEAIRSEAIVHLADSRGEELDVAVTDPINRVRWQALAMHGEIDAAIAVLAKINRNDASEVLAQCSRYADAFTVLDVDWTDIENELSVLIDDVIKSQKKSPAEDNDEPTPELARLLACVRLLVATGRDSLALETLDAISRSQSVIIDDEMPVARLAIIRAVARMNRPEWIGNLLLGPEDSGLSARAQFFLAISFDAKLESVAALIEAFTKMRPESKFSERVRDTATFLAGKRPASFDERTGYPALFRALADSKQVIRDYRRDGSFTTVPRLSLDIARLFELHGQPELAKQALMNLALDGDIEAKLMLAEAELKNGSAEQASQLFRSVWDSLETAGKSILRLNQADADGLLAMRAIYGEAIAAKRLGDGEGESELTELIQLMSCTPSALLRNSFAEFLVQEGRDEAAGAIYEPLLRLAAFGATDGVEFYSIARNFDSAVSQTRPFDAAAAFDLAIAGTLETTVFYPAAYVSLPSYVHRRMATFALEAKDEPALRKQIDRLLKLDPVDIDFGEKVIEKMFQAKMDVLATETLERIYQAGKLHLDQFPLDVGMSNNLAWVLALSDYHMDEALTYSRRAVFYSPESTVYRDTLAEVLFRSGRVEEAIELEKACLLDDPAEWHVHEQLRRFTASQNASSDSEKRKKEPYNP